MDKKESVKLRSSLTLLYIAMNPLKLNFGMRVN